MKTSFLKFLILGSLLACKVPTEIRKTSVPSLLSGVLYSKTLGNSEAYPEILFNDAVAQYTVDGLKITGNSSLVQLNKFYALGERLIRYQVKFSKDAIATFQSNTGDFKAYVDVPGKTISIATTPAIVKSVSFLNPDHAYIIEIYHVYQLARVRITDLSTGQSEEIKAVNNGTGGCGVGAESKGIPGLL